MTEPKIHTRNYLDSQSTITLSHSAGNPERLYDADRLTQWISSGANNDATELIQEFTFNEAGAEISRSIDRIFIINHNFSDFEFEYWTGAAWSSLASASGITDANNAYTFSATSFTKCRIRVSATQVANAEKTIGQVTICKLSVDVGKELSRYNAMYRQKKSSLVLGDGALHESVILHSTNRSQKYGARILFRLLTEAELDALIALKETGAAFLWQPESEHRLEEIYYVHWTNVLRWTYSGEFKGAGYTLPMDVKEV